MKMEYRDIRIQELNLELFQDFNRRQVVNDCWRRDHGEWTIKPDPFIDDWSAEDYCFLINCLKNTIQTGGFVYGAFHNGKLKGFVSVEGTPFGSRGQYLDLSSLQVSEDLSRTSIGRVIIIAAKAIAKAMGAEKLYLSAHSAVETQAFYHSMGCTEAEEYDKAHTDKEPFDCQMECRV